ncbi:MAG: autotransporter outer membrane beta-barrel domain-containing protein [Parasphingorhabdus sp.]|uniref:autotransporter outer membrane beta-barrel domain-containing protein n=1 Tax=Parasphingorhabdus sp. TaxID=2709688 RepID=UPI00329A4777
MSSAIQTSQYYHYSANQKHKIAARCSNRHEQILQPLSGLRLSVSAAAMASALLFGSGLAGTAPATAGTCAESAVTAGVFICSDPAAADTTQILDGLATTVTTEADFGIATAAGDAFDINGIFGAFFEDTHASQIIGADNGIRITNSFGAPLSVTANGTIEGQTGIGISAINGLGATDLTISSNNVSGLQQGIYAYNAGYGALTIESVGSSYALLGNAISAVNSTAGTDLTVQAHDSTGGQMGIYAANQGSGALTINSTGTVSGGGGLGIFAYNLTDGTNLTVTAHNSGGADYGIGAINRGRGSLTITTTGAISGSGASGIFAYNSVNDLSGMLRIDQMGESTITGSTTGIYAQNQSGQMIINAFGTVTGLASHGIDARNAIDTTSLTVISNIAIGQGDGIHARNRGSGALTVTSLGSASGATDDGIFAYNHADGTDLTIAAMHANGGVTGIAATNIGQGATTITATGSVNGATGSGIIISNSVTGTGISINAVDTSGYLDGIRANNLGSGALTISATGLTASATANGIQASNSNTGTALTLTAAHVAGNNNGIWAENLGSGGLTITSTGDISGQTRDGIFADNISTSADSFATIEQLAGTTIYGSSHGIYVDNHGGSLTINAQGTVIGEFESAIEARNRDTGVDLTISSNITHGADYGIYAVNQGSGALTINSTGLSSGEFANGIVAFGSEFSTDVTINSMDSLGEESGIVAFTRGTGSITVTVNGTATGTTEYGVYAYNRMTADSMALTIANAIGGTNGVRTLNYGSGGLTVSMSGNVTGQSADGVYAYNSANDLSGTLSIEQNAASTISGAGTGIIAENLSGALTIAAYGSVNGQSGNGIAAYNAAGTSDLTIISHQASGGTNGIIATQQGTGALSITSTGTVTSNGDNGITATNTANGTSLTINVVDVVAAERGIRVNNEGSGALNISSSGTVSASEFIGIGAYNSANGSALSINATNVSGRYGAIYAENLGGSLNILVSGSAESTDGDAIDARNRASAEALTIISQTTQGGGNGILAINYGSGSLSIESVGPASGQAYDGISAFNASSGGDLTIAATETTGGYYGIEADNLGTGELSISATGMTTGIAANGIHAENSIAGTSLSIAAASVVGGSYGIYARNFGAAGLTISASGDVTGQSQSAIFAYNSANDVSASMVIDLEANTITSGATHGVEAENLGGSLTINALGTTIGETQNAIWAVNRADTTHLTITSHISEGATNGIYAYNEGTGSLTINSTNFAAGANLSGIETWSSTNSSALSIAATHVRGGTYGIRAQNYGDGALTISVSGDVTGEGTDGIRAYNSANANNAALTLTQSQESVISGALDGIYTENFGGSLSIESLGTIIGVAGDAINARNGVGTDNLMITSNIATGADNGIRAIHQGDGALAIISLAYASGTDANGIYAQNASGTDLSISAQDTNGETHAIRATNFGSGALQILSNGSASATMMDGIYAENAAAGTELSIVAAHVRGGQHGIYASQQGIGDLNLTTTGNIAGGTGNAVTAVTTGSTIQIENSGHWESGTEFALSASGGATLLTNSGHITGRISTGIFDDNIHNLGIFEAILDSDFGDGNDLFLNESTIIINGGLAWLGLEQLTNNGLVDMANETVGNSLNLPGGYTGNGLLGLDVSFDDAGSADRLTVAGLTTGSTGLILNDISLSPNIDVSVLVVDAQPGTAEEAFALNDAAQTIGFAAYRLSYDAPNGDFYLTNAIGAPLVQTLKFTEGAQSLWYRSADAWAAHMATRRDAPGAPLWMQIYGSLSDQEESFEFTSSGFSQVTNLDYDQDYFGFQMGYDFATQLGDDMIIFGVTTGYLDSDLRFDQMADNISYGAFNIGAYAGIDTGGFFANALVKYDFINADIEARTAGYSADLNGHGFGMRLETGYRFGDEKFFIQPLSSFEWQQSSLGDLATLGAQINFDTYDGLRAMAGLRLGGETKVKGDNQLRYYFGGHAVHQSQSKDGFMFTSGASSLALDNRLSNSFGRFEAGLNITSPNGVTGFFEANADLGGGYRSFGGRTGIKIAF